jgi:glutathione synthase/RimK-type ligase-like ATP-grasp enzyme
MENRKAIRVAIHHRAGSFSDRWIEYCEENRINYTVVDCQANDIVEKLKFYDVLLWNWEHTNYRDIKLAPHVISAAEKMGLLVFPSTDSCQTFDNKIAQKYQLESIGAPLVPTFIFFEEKTALDWLSGTSFPKVFKLSRGSAALNVSLIKNYAEGKYIVKKAFRSGFKNSSGHVKENLIKLSSQRARGQYDWLGKIKRLPNSLFNIYRINRMMGREIGYAYFQEFIPNQKHDTRVVIIGNRAFAFQRKVREGDFRASGSGFTVTAPEIIDTDFIKIGFEISDKLNLQSAAYDFIRDVTNVPYLLEVSYTFPSNKQVKDCPGHWDKNMNWHEGTMWPQDAIISDIMREMEVRNK